MANYFIDRQKRTTKYYSEDLGNGIKLDMVLIPEGNFLMGASESELDSRDLERPQHQVKVSTFFMGRYRVTQEQWLALATLPQVDRELKPDPSAFKGDQRPVERVNWYEAKEFCARLSKHTAREYRLPSEAEWEYACRAGMTTPFHFGETISTDLANYNGKSTYGEGETGQYLGETTPVDKFGIANDFGLCDMHGNVCEWCEDHWHNDYQNAPIDGSSWTTNGNSYLRVIRGGSWLANPSFCRSATRNYGNPEDASDFIGFRVVCRVPRTL